MLHLDTAEDDGSYLPQVTPTPRPLTTQPGPTPRSMLTPRPLSSRVSCSTLTREEKPRRSLKQVSRGHRQWTSGLTDCAEDRTLCCYTCICPCTTLWNVADRLDENCCVAWLPGATVAMRTKVRTIGGIRGSLVGDYCAGCCCPLLTTCQLAREVGHMVVRPEEYVQPVI